MKLQFKVLALVCVLAILIGGYFWIDRKFHEDMAFNNEFKRMHVASGTLMSISGGATKPPASISSNHAYTVCFTIDSFSDIPHELKAEYTEAERSRMAKDGARCIHVSDQSPSIAGMPGEAIQVYYLLYGQGKITVERLTVRGQKLNAM